MMRWLREFLVICGLHPRRIVKVGAQIGALIEPGIRRRLSKIPGMEEIATWEMSQHCIVLVSLHNGAELWGVFPRGADMDGLNQEIADFEATVRRAAA